MIYEHLIELLYRKILNIQLKKKEKQIVALMDIIES